MTIKRKIALGLCLFLTLTPFIGSYFSADNTPGKYIGNLTPYTHMTMSQLGGLPFTEAMGGLYGIFIFLIGFIGFIIFIATGFRKTGGLLLLLYLTIIYSGLRALGGIVFNLVSFSNYDTKAKIFIIAVLLSDILWVLVCYWATTILTKEKLVTDIQDVKDAS